MFFARCKEFNILINPDKCKLGYTEVEYVGHTLDGDGLHFSDEKLNGVDQLALPQTPKGLESFLGLVNYFSSHVRNFIDGVSPISLHTDASEYGIGAYLFQQVDSIEQPIMFISCSLNSTG